MGSSIRASIHVTILDKMSRVLIPFLLTLCLAYGASGLQCYYGLSPDPEDWKEYSCPDDACYKQINMDNEDDVMRGCAYGNVEDKCYKNMDGFGGDGYKVCFCKDDLCNGANSPV